MKVERFSTKHEALEIPKEQLGCPKQLMEGSVIPGKEIRTCRTIKYSMWMKTHSVMIVY